MMQHFQEAVTAGRAKMETGEAVGGLLGQMLAAVDEEGNRWVGSLRWGCGNQLVGHKPERAIRVWQHAAVLPR